MENSDELYKVPSLEKGLYILEYLSHNHEGCSLQEIKSELNISQTTAYRILNSIARLGYISYDEKTKLYTLTKKLLTLGFRTLEEHHQLKVVIPYLYALRNRVRETVCYGVLGDEKGIFIEQAQGLHTFSFMLTPGHSFDLHCSAPGKAIMAHLPDVARQHYLSMMNYHRYNERTITNQEDYLKELQRVLDEGYAMDNEEELTGVICIATPIFSFSGFPTGAIWVSGPKDRLSKREIANIVQELQQTAKEISQQLGHQTSKRDK